MKFRYDRRIYSWAMYDWANSAFATTIMASVLPAYYSDVAAATLEPHLATSYWGYTNTISMALIALLAPLLGAIADHKRSKIRMLGGFAAGGIFFTAMLYLVQRGDWLLASALYIFARTGFSGANIFYDSLLPHIAGSKEVDRISALGYAAGYLGGALLLALNILMIMNPQLFGILDAQTATRFAFLSVALWWLLFSIPVLRYVAEPEAGFREMPTTGLFRAAFGRLVETFKNLRTYRQAFRFLIAFWLYNDGIGTIIVMAVIFGAEIGIGQSSLIGAILVVQLIGIPFTLLFARLADRISAKNAVIMGLVVYTILSVGGYFMQNELHFWILALVVGMVQGGTQALSRSLYSKMIPPAKSSEFFGFFDVSQKFSGILGPAVFALVGQLAGSSRLGITALVVFFLSGILLLLKVDVARGIAAISVSGAKVNVNQ